jgi:phosphohistidine swiveling domain-containing protein
MSYKETNWAIAAADYDAPLVRIEIWVRGMARYPEFLGTDALTTCIVGRDGSMEYIVVWDTWKHVHEQLKAKALGNAAFVDQLIEKAQKKGEEANRWSQKNIQEVNLKVKSLKQLIQLYRETYDIEEELYALGTALPVLDFQKFSYIEGSLKKFLKKFPEEKQKEYFRVFTEPVHNSFAQDQEEALLKLMGKHIKKEGWKEAVLNKPEELQQLFPEFFKQLQEHTKKYCWVYYVYRGPAFTEENFIEFIRDHLKKDIDSEKKLQEIKEKKQKTKQLKEQYITETNPDEFNKEIINLAGKVVWAKPRRKDYQSKTYYHLEKLQREIAERLSLTLKEVRHMPLEDIEKALNGEEINKTKIQETINCHAVVPDGNKIKILYGKEAEYFYNTYVKKENKEIEQTDIIKGACACKGKARGIVKVINKKEDMQKMNEGDILVSSATTPSIIAAMRKAAAFITDEGGLTCHAAIVSRELNTPCVVGTKIATRLLKDGDFVEVDAENGLVKKL